jgi:hypothetical protein
MNDLLFRQGASWMVRLPLPLGDVAIKGWKDR